MAEYRIHCISREGEDICEEYDTLYRYDIERFGIVFTESGNIAYHDKQSSVIIPHAIFEQMIKDYEKYKKESSITVKEK